MTKDVTRYTQPMVQTQPGPEFAIAEVPLFEDPKGKWVRYEDIKHLLSGPHEPSVTLDASLSCPDCGAGRAAPGWEHDCGAEKS